MRQNSAPTLSPLPPYPGGSPTAALPSPPALSTSLPAASSALPESPSTEESCAMRTTHIHPRSAPVSPRQPASPYSTRSTIRQVEPSPERVSDACADTSPGQEEQAPGPSEPFPVFNPGQDDDEETADDKPRTHIPSTEPAAAAGALRRGGTPSGRTSPRKSRSSSPQKSRSQSPRKYKVRTPTLPAHQDSSSSASSKYSAPADSEDERNAKDTPTPTPRMQQRDVYAPLQIRRPFASSNSAGEPASGQGTHARIADYMRKARAKEQRGGPVLDAVTRVVAAPAAHIVQAMALPGELAQSRLAASSSSSAVQREPVRHTSESRRSEASGASVASRHSIFSTPGRDELERKKPIVEEDEGPFAKATSMQDLKEKRRVVSAGTMESIETEGARRACGMKCVVM